MMIYNSNNIPAIHTYKDAVRYGARVLKQADIDNPDYDALELFLYVTGIDRTTYLINATDEIDNKKITSYSASAYYGIHIFLWKKVYCE